MNALLAHLGGGLARLFLPGHLEIGVEPDGPHGPLKVPSGGDGVWRVVYRDGRPCLTPSETSYYLYFCLPERFRRGATLSA